MVLTVGWIVERHMNMSSYYKVTNVGVVGVAQNSV